jgi:hypothetical protein
MIPKELRENSRGTGNVLPRIIPFESQSSDSNRSAAVEIRNQVFHKNPD